ncbi:hypothetical protein BJY52DRAFT_1396253 [Lactarius psammicola]|nr:hypothetical protein BJY52DRAFT_1396253 [Lactarius psammicola]
MDHYSSLFTMGLLSERASPVSSPSRSNFFFKFRKSSLPTKALSKPSEMYTRGDGRFYPNDAPPPQFTNPFGDSPNATDELRSFLSLDLAADSTSTARRSSKYYLSPLDKCASPAYSANLSPYVSNATTTYRRCISNVLFVCVDRRQHHPDTMAPLSLPPARRPSRDSLRTLPSPGPAPSTALPDIPSGRENARLPPPIIIPSSSLLPVVPSSSSPGGGSLMFPQPPHSAPPNFAPSSDIPSFVSPPSPSLSPVSPVSRRAQQHASFISFASNVTSIRTARRRNAERSNALACLEGLSRAPGRIPRNTRQQNFMSMSDDEDEEGAMDDTDAGKDADVEDDDDTFTTLPPPPPPPPRSGRTRASSFVLPASLPSGYVATVNGSRSPIDEEEDCVLPPAAISALRQTSPSKPRTRSRRSTLESWFPLANFIDLKDEELSSWRGVVEIVNGL